MTKKGGPKLLVTGCAGFIGSQFVDHLIEIKKVYPKNIIGIDNFSTGRRDRVNKKITFYEGSVTDPELVNKIFKKHKPDYVFHFAAIPRVSYSVEYPAKTTNNNITGLVNVLESAKNYKAKRVIYSSSSSVYGKAESLPVNEEKNKPNPLSPYALQKHMSELLCKMFSTLYGLDTVSLRYFNVYGPGQYGDSPYSTVISAWLDGIYHSPNKKLFLEGNGKQSRDFCFVENVIQANIKAMETKKPLKGEAINIAHGERTNLSTVKKLIEKHSDTEIKLASYPPRIGDIPHTQADISKAKKLLGYTPSINFEEGLKKTIDWHKFLISK